MRAGLGSRRRKTCRCREVLPLVVIKGPVHWGPTRPVQPVSCQAIILSGSGTRPRTELLVLLAVAMSWTCKTTDMRPATRKHCLAMWVPLVQSSSPKASNAPKRTQRQHHYSFQRPCPKGTPQLPAAVSSTHLARSCACHHTCMQGKHQLLSSHLNAVCVPVLFQHMFIDTVHTGTESAIVITCMLCKICKRYWAGSPVQQVSSVQVQLIKIKLVVSRPIKRLGVPACRIPMHMQVTCTSSVSRS